MGGHERDETTGRWGPPDPTAGSDVDRVRSTDSPSVVRLTVPA
ncbi:hypothetical protein C485_15200 [Natrinema altunense JCM 12890]|uniref:Uncharacterized protein n=1 Tax=Natrinema altunense (strain JCM 12890 / CGMCC 1.3731 / AJ2) TaxID=1227494 RepID=L9ZF93_NATA2|nr:hypothetical protein C485_15200 [Natrinema altunense JCM 12890]